MTESQKKKCHAIIHTASTAAAGVGVGLAQVPGSDNAVIVPIQITMVISLAKVFGKELDEAGAAAVLSTAATSVVGRGISQVLVGWIPVIGNAINASTAAGVTEVAGWTVAKIFDNET